MSYADYKLIKKQYFSKVDSLIFGFDVAIRTGNSLTSFQLKLTLSPKKGESLAP